MCFQKHIFKVNEQLVLDLVQQNRYTIGFHSSRFARRVDVPVAECSTSVDRNHRKWNFIGRNFYINYTYSTSVKQHQNSCCGSHKYRYNVIIPKRDRERRRRKAKFKMSDRIPRVRRSNRNNPLYTAAISLAVAFLIFHKMMNDFSNENNVG